MLGPCGFGGPNPNVLRERSTGSYSGAAVDVWVSPRGVMQESMV